MTIYTHPVLEGPFVFLPVPTPSFRDQLKLKNKLLEITQNCPSRPGSATCCSDKHWPKLQKSCPKSGQKGNITETTHENKHRMVQLNLPHTPPAPQSESNNRHTQLALAASTCYLFRRFITGMS